MESIILRNKQIQKIGAGFSLRIPKDFIDNGDLKLGENYNITFVVVKEKSDMTDYEIEAKR